MGGRARRLRNPWVRLGLFSGALGLFLLGYWWGNQYKQGESPRMESAILVHPPLPLPDFSATDGNGRPLGPGRFEGRWSLLLLGTPDHPETTRGLALQTRILNRLAATPDLQRALRPVLISPLPDRNTPVGLRETAAAYNPALVTGSGTVTALQPLLAALGGGQDIPPTLYLIDPAMHVIALFTPRQDPATIARDIQRLMSDAP